MSAGFTQTVSSDEPEPSLVVATLPVLSTTPLPGHGPAVVLSVCEVMCTVKVDAFCVVFAGTVTGPQSSSVPAGLIAQLLFQPAPCASIDQDTPAFCGSGSDNVTPLASPTPAFQTVTVKPMSSPAFTDAASAFFKI